MKPDFKLTCRSHPDRDTACDVSRFGPEQAGQVRAFHRSIPGYAPTPLAELTGLAGHLGLKNLWVKDESFRFGLNAFKVLGGSWAIANYMAGRLNRDVRELTYEQLVSPETRKALGDVTFVTATDGNHGRGVAWTASRLGQNSVVYLPKGSAPERLANIRALGAEASITDLNYDDTVRLARDRAEERGWALIQDTSWPGYEEIPGWIMEGYTTMAHEAEEQLEGQVPTHVFLQAGVGAMAGAVAGYFAARYGPEQRPRVVVVEPNGADCIYRTAKADDGTLHTVSGGRTIMAGLNCGEPCPLGWKVLGDYGDWFLSLPDFCAAHGMRVLGNPLPGDARIISGESGAATMGALLELAENPGLSMARDMLGLDGNARVLCFSTEGDTDRDNYRRIVWDGAWGLP